MRQIVLLSGRTCTGKSKLGRQLSNEFKFRLIKTSDILAKKEKEKKRPSDRLSLQAAGDILDRNTKYKWIYDEISKLDSELSLGDGIIVDCIRNKKQLGYIRANSNWRVVHVHLYASDEKLKERYLKKKKNRSGESAKTHEKADLIKSERDIGFFKKDADVRINTNIIDSSDTFTRVAARIGLFASPDLRCVDVIVGGQYGSEGKGHVAAYLAKEYDVLVRVGGPNAGHTVSSPSGVYTYHHLPSGCKDTNAEVLLGPGMTIRVKDLLKEINECDLKPGRLFIDPQVMVIEDKDVKAESNLIKAISSTGRGGGAAMARRIAKRGVGDVRLARDIDQLAAFIHSTVDRLENAFRQGSSVLVEGTQGSALSLFHGPYPYVTSRETNVSGCLAEAGISPMRVRPCLQSSMT